VASLDYLILLHQLQLDGLGGARRRRRRRRTRTRRRRRSGLDEE